MKNFILACLMTLGLSVSYDVIANSKEPAVVYSAIPNNPTLLLLSLIGIYLFLTYVQKKSVKTNWLQTSLSLFFAYCTWSITIYESGIKTINQIISGNLVGVFFSVLTIGSYTIILNGIQGILTNYIEQPKLLSVPELRILEKPTNYFAKNPFLTSFVIIFSVWLVIAISSFPSVFMGDSLDQVEQFLGIQTRTAAHPVLSTMFIGVFVKIGQLLGHPNMGVFLYTVSQLFIVSILVSFSINLVYGLTKRAGSLLAVSLLIALLPSINGTVILATKDIIFSGFFVLYIVTLAIFFLDEKKFFQDKLWIYHSLSIIFMMLFRYNTIHFIGLSLIVYILAEIVGRKRIIRKTSLVLLTIATLFIGSGMNHVLVSVFAEKDLTPNRREMLSLPFQQTARYIKYHEDEISAEDKEIIESVLDYDVIKNNYNPVRSDAVKRTHKEDATDAEMAAYFKLVAKQTLAHPLVTLESVTASHGNLFNVNKSVNDYYKNGVVLDADEKGMLARYEVIGLSDSNVFLKLNKVRLFFYSLWDRLPILSQINNYGVHMFVFLSLFVLCLRKKHFELAAIFIPVGAFVGTLIAGPITQGYLRYELPVILITPILFVLTVSTFKKNQS